MLLLSRKDKVLIYLRISIIHLIYRPLSCFYWLSHTSTIPIFNDHSKHYVHSPVTE